MKTVPQNIVAINVFQVGDLAYYDSFSGLIPCKVLAVNDAMAGKELAGFSSFCRVSVRLTAKRGAWEKGEVVESDALKVVPRTHIRGLRSRSCMPRIIGGYRWTAIPKE